MLKWLRKWRQKPPAAIELTMGDMLRRPYGEVTDEELGPALAELRRRVWAEPDQVKAMRRLERSVAGRGPIRSLPAEARCRYCDAEMLEDKAAWWYVRPEKLIWMRCAKCKHTSRWDMLASMPVCVDNLPLTTPDQRRTAEAGTAEEVSDADG